MKMEAEMNLEERIQNGMLFYESGHKSPENQEIEKRLDKERKHCKEMMFDYNHCRPGNQEERQSILKKLLGSCGEQVYIGDRTMIGPNVTICTTGHPIDPTYRDMVAHYSIPIHIGKNVWIGSNSVILPGVTIGDNTVIGAGSIVTRDIPENVVAVGNPCRILRTIEEKDKEYYFRDLKVDEPYTSRQGNE